MEKIKVIEVDRYRDGGTVVYQDELNRQYFTFRYSRNKKVWNKMPFSKGNIGEDELKPHPSVKEIPVELEIVDSFK